MALHKHQLDYLIAELQKPEFMEKKPDAAYESIRRPTKAFLAVSWVPQSKYDKKPEKLRKGMIPVPDEYAALFPGGVPGMPNLIRREDFNEARLKACGYVALA